MPKKKTASKKKSATRKPSAAKKAAAKKAAKKTPTGKKAARKTPATKASSSKKAPAKKKTSTRKKASAKRKAIDLVKRPSHTPAIFKPASKRPAAILFTMEEVREVLKKRAKEEKSKEAAKKAAASGQKEAPKVAGRPDVEASEPQKKSKHAAASLEDILGLSGGGSGGSAGGGSASNKIPKKFQKYYNLLMELRHEVREELNLHTSDTLKRSQKEDAGDISISVDAGTDNFDRDFALSLLSSEQEALNEIEAAIDRIHKGTYGVCEVTGEPIKEDRLEAVPFTRFSVEGQKQYEMNLRKRVSRAGAFLNEASGEKITFGDDDGDN